MSLPLAVDMDGTLLKTDVLAEALLRHQWLLAAAPVLLAIGGRPALKRFAARHAKLDIAALPYREDFIAWLRAEKARGRALVLATAADRETAERVAAHVGLFDGVLASEGRVNLKAHAKAAALAARFPDGFVYAGDGAADLPVWRTAKAAVLVNVKPALKARVVALGVPIEAAFG